MSELFFYFCLLFLQFRRCLLQLLCSRITWLQQSFKERPLTKVERPIRPIVMTRSCSASNRPKKKVTFSSSSIVFIITSDNFHQLDMAYKAGKSSEVNVIQVRPLWFDSKWTFPLFFLVSLTNWCLKSLFLTSSGYTDAIVYPCLHMLFLKTGIDAVILEY